jgi:tetratricopeptide (TPR) repeat protein
MGHIECERKLKSPALPSPEKDMTRTFAPASLAALVAALVALPGTPAGGQARGTTPPRAEARGTIAFPTSGAPAAQPAFVEGVKDLYNFEFDEAADAFRRAQQADPSFAMAYWGEAMSYNHPLWAQQDSAAARRTLERLAPTFEGRAAKARTPKEKAYLGAAEALFYGPGGKLARDVAYSDSMAAMHARWPDDHEVATLYALSLLGTVRPGDKGFRRQALAAAVAEAVWRENPRHPGAAHYIIHAFDDPDHAPLALPAARAYADIAPAAAHALHMPSHIFVQLGMWPDVARSNTVAFKAATDLIARMKLPEGREDFHALGWLTYANLMMGRFDEARANVETARATAYRNPGNAGVRDAYLGMRARYILESGRWERIALDAAPATPATATGDAHAAMPGMQTLASPTYAGRNTWTFIAGYSAAKLGDTATAAAAEAGLKAARERLEAAGNAYGAKPVAILEKELGAVSRFARGQRDVGVALAKEAMDLELTLGAPSGPPEPIKPAAELYGELLLEAGRPADARRVLEVALQRTPNRTPSVRAMQRTTQATQPATQQGRATQAP